MPKLKVTTYIDPEVWKAAKRLAVEKNVPVAKVVEQALSRAIPDKYFK